MATKDISDEQVVEACRLFHAGDFRGSVNILAETTGQPIKVCLSAMERAHRRGLIEYGVSLGTAWPMDLLQVVKKG